MFGSGTAADASGSFKFDEHGPVDGLRDLTGQSSFERSKLSGVRRKRGGRPGSPFWSGTVAGARGNCKFDSHGQMDGLRHLTGPAFIWFVHIVVFGRTREYAVEG